MCSSSFLDTVTLGGRIPSVAGQSVKRKKRAEDKRERKREFAAQQARVAAGIRARQSASQTGLSGEDTRSLLSQQ